MISALKKIRARIDKTHPAGHLPYRLEDIRKAIMEVTNVDRIELIEFDDPNNPIKGRYERYDGAFGPYQPRETKVDIYHAKDLNFCWTRFVICKELCHALETF